MKEGKTARGSAINQPIIVAVERSPWGELPEDAAKIPYAHCD
jgi:hypothetical protein